MVSPGDPPVVVDVADKHPAVVDYARAEASRPCGTPVIACPS